MKNKHRFYTNSNGVDPEGFKKVFKEAVTLSQTLGNESRIVFIAHGLQNDGWLERLFGFDTAKKMRKGIIIDGFKLKFESLKTYQTVKDEIVITMGLDSDAILNIDANYHHDGVIAIYAIPWLKDDVIKWAKMTGAINIDDNTVADSQPELDCVIIKALEDLSESINMTTGLSHPSDDKLAKTYLRTLHKYGYELDPVSIESYLINQLYWTKENADELLDIINKINSGRSFHGGDKTNIKHHISRWKKECK